MNEADSGRLVVIDDGKMVGFMTLTGVARIIQIKAQLGGNVDSAETPKNTASPTGMITTPKTVRTSEVFISTQSVGHPHRGFS
jgi:hypothetical protein